MSDQTSPDDLRSHVKGKRFVMLTTTSPEGELQSRPMTVQEFEGWTMRFIAQDDDDAVRHSEGKEVNVSIMDGGEYVSLSGTGAVNRSVEEKKALWGRLNEAYAGEPEDPRNVILDITVSAGSYWDAGNPVARAIGLAKAALTGETGSGHGGEHGSTDV